MSDTSRKKTEMQIKKIVLPLCDSVEIPVRKGLAYGSKNLEMDIYYPPGQQKPAAAVLFVTGFPDAGYQRIMGCKQKEMGSYRSWARLMAQSGMAAILYENKDPVEDAHRALAYVRDNADALVLNPNQIGLWACSANVPNGLSLLKQRERDLRCAVFCYGYMLDEPGSAWVSQAASQFGFVIPKTGDASQLPCETPLLVIRAGKDQMPGLLPSIDYFLRLGLNRNAPISHLNIAQGPHAFDLDWDTDDSRRMIRNIVSYLIIQLSY